LLLIAVLVCGCSQVQRTALQDQTDRYDNFGSEDVFVTKLQSYEDGDSSVVYGKVKRGPDLCCEAVRGHVDIAVFDSDGSVLETASTFYRPRNIPKARTRSSSFKVELPISLPDGATIRGAYHDTAEHAVFTEGEKTFECLYNRALPGLQAKAAQESDVY
jgi:hypothetical protein